MICEKTLKENGTIYTKKEMDKIAFEICQIQKNENLLVFGINKEVSYFLKKGYSRYDTGLHIDASLKDYSLLSPPVTFIDLISKQIFTQSAEVFKLCNSDLYKEKGMLITYDNSKKILIQSLESIKESLQILYPPKPKKKDHCIVS